MKFCIKCGGKVPAGAIFCADCGASLSYPPDQASTESAIPQGKLSGTVDQEEELRSIYEPPHKSESTQATTSKAAHSTEVPFINSKESAPIALWNPTAAISWSVIFSPIFGAWLLALNWKRLGDRHAAIISALWGIMFFVGATMVDQLGAKIAGKLYFYLYLGLFYYFNAKSQIDLVEKTMIGVYEKRRWRYPLTIAFGCGALIIWANISG